MFLHLDPATWQFLCKIKGHLGLEARACQVARRDVRVWCWQREAAPRWWQECVKAIIEKEGSLFIKLHERISLCHLPGFIFLCTVIPLYYISRSDFFPKDSVFKVVQTTTFCFSSLGLRRRLCKHNGTCDAFIPCCSFMLQIQFSQRIWERIAWVKVL